MSTDNAHARFADDWLSLREPVDHAARDARLTTRTAQWLKQRSGAHTIVDLGSGRGSNLRYLAPRLPGPQRWRLIDHDTGLLEQALRDTDTLVDAEGQPIEAAAQPRDLTDTTLESALDGARLVTAAALFDLVTEAWIERLSHACAQRGAAALFVLSVDGSIDFTPGDSDDAWVAGLLQAHQRRDKSFGAALGIEAPQVLSRCFGAQGYAVQTAASVWQIDTQTRALGCALIAGWRDAACEQSPDDHRRITTWAERRQRALCARELHISVSHYDMFAAPPTR